MSSKQIHYFIYFGIILWITFVTILYIGLQQRAHHMKWREVRLKNCIHNEYDYNNIGKSGHLVYNPFYPDNHACIYGDIYRKMDSKGNILGVTTVNRE